MTGASRLKKAGLMLKICENCIFCRERYGQRFMGVSTHLIYRFSDRTTNHQ